MSDERKMNPCFAVEWVKAIEDKFSRDMTFAEWEGKEGAQVELPNKGNGSMLSWSTDYRIAHLISGLFCYHRPRTILEAGTNAGTLTNFMCYLAEELGYLDEIRIDTIDLDPEIYVNCKIGDEFPQYQSHINRIAGRTEDEIPKLPNDYYEFLVCDGDHSENGALTDLLSMWDKITRKGILLVHDTRNPESGVGKAVKIFTEAYPEANQFVFPLDWQGVSIFQKFQYGEW